MEPLRQRFLTYLDESKASPDAPRSSPLAFGPLVLCVATALFLAATVPYHHRLAAPLAPLCLALVVKAVAGRIELAEARRRRRRRREVVGAGVPVTAYIAWSHERLERPGTQSHPCLALITFDADASRDSDYLRYLAGRCDARPTPLRRYRRRRLPESRTDGYEIYLVDLDVCPGYLESGYLSGAPLPCLAEVGERGGIELVPYWLVFPIQGGTGVSERGERV